MSEIPKIIDHVPTTEELTGSQPNPDTMNMRDPAQLAEINAARQELGFAPAAAPSPKAEIVVTPQTHEPTATGEPLRDIDRPVSKAELADLRRQIAAEVGHTVVPREL